MSSLFPYHANGLNDAKMEPCTFKERGVTLAVTNALACYWLDGTTNPKGYFPDGVTLCSSSNGGKRCDGLLVGKCAEKGYVVFVDLKRGKIGNVGAQLENCACYFCRCTNGTGSAHHSNVAEDLPREHDVLLVVVGTAIPPKSPREICSKQPRFRYYPPPPRKRRGAVDFCTFLQQLRP